MRKVITCALLSVAVTTANADALPSDLHVVQDENIQFTKSCPENWYLVQQTKPIFTNGMPPYRAVSTIGITHGGEDIETFSIENLPTDFGSYSSHALTKYPYITDIIPNENMALPGEVNVGTIVATKHVALENNTRRMCLYAEHIEVSGYRTVEVPGMGRYQKPDLMIRRFIGEVAVDRRNTAYVQLGKDSVVEASLKVDIKKFN